MTSRKNRTDELWNHSLRRAREQPAAGLDAEKFFDPESVRWYRRVFRERNPGRHQALSDVEFLNELGLVVEHGERLVPTRAAVLVFGRPRHVRRILPRPVVDCQFIDSTSGSWTTDQRWTDRIVVEEKFVQAWLTLCARHRRHATHPFGVDAATLRRDDDPPDYGAAGRIRPVRPRRTPEGQLRYPRSLVSRRVTKPGRVQAHGQ